MKSLKQFINHIILESRDQNPEERIFEDCDGTLYVNIPATQVKSQFPEQFKLIVRSLKYDRHTFAGQDGIDAIQEEGFGIFIMKRVGFMKQIFPSGDSALRLFATDDNWEPSWPVISDQTHRGEEIDKPVPVEVANHYSRTGYVLIGSGVFQNKAHSMWYSAWDFAKDLFPPFADNKSKERKQEDFLLACLQLGLTKQEIAKVHSLARKTVELGQMYSAVEREMEQLQHGSGTDNVDNEVYQMTRELAGIKTELDRIENEQVGQIFAAARARTMKAQGIEE